MENIPWPDALTPPDANGMRVYAYAIHSVY